MEMSDLRIALFSGNYNMTVDGANKALNRLVGYLLSKGAQVRVYSPTIDNPGFQPTGELVSVPSMVIPNRPEYRIPLSFSRRVQRDIEAFNPNVLHISSPDRVSRQAAAWARRRNIPVIASVHTRFETYFRYYNMSFVEPLMVAWIRKLYRRCDALIAPSESFAQVLREQRMNFDIGIWTRGVERDIFSPDRRDMEWRRSIGLADDEPAIAFLGRLVMEKGLDVFADTIDQLKRQKVRHEVIVIGEGPAGDWFRSRMPNAKFVGFQSGKDLARAMASSDMLFNPSVTETFGNVTLEAMACGKPVVAARATGSASIVKDGVTGYLVEPGSITGFADRLQNYCNDPGLRKKHGNAALAESNKYDWDTINQVVADTYIRLIRQRQSGQGPIQSKAIR
ncbi:glycosyltransferase family 4 protein [Parasphingorhabdus halotolerans]|uniref:Glycosyltransferase family 1 protein n=1 Tax=Parasphingorhabdus halotolerans TaxID=2725558 RepID=A0A6H2DJY5_9SPHN|nr:glycosyltransferase family 1 protein [Parasphingorhabdus halotolerans]QJB68508.1 glycosyltransferase family 1 protein [Parasphingorhabdus halotolerans]